MPDSALILITCATRSIGSVLVRKLCESEQSVRALVRNPQRAALLPSLPNLEVFIGNLGRPESLRGCAQGCA